MESNQDLRRFTQDVQKIKNAILQSRYHSASNANAEMLSLYYGVGKYISANTRVGKWGASAIEMISNQLQGEIPGLKGFSPTNMKNMRIFFEEWSSELEANRQSMPADLREKADSDDELLIRQTLSDELGEIKIIAFYRIGFSLYSQATKCIFTMLRYQNLWRRFSQSLKASHMILKRQGCIIGYGRWPNHSLKEYR